MSPLPTRLPASDLAGEGRPNWARDTAAGVAVAFLAIPQGVAYALVAGLPPAMGLYAATLPTIVGSLLRSSRHVITGPTNAVSLLVGAAVAAQLTPNPAVGAVTLALLVGAIQVVAGILRLGGLVYFVAHPVVLGYITGAAVLIGVGQLHHLTGTAETHGVLPRRLVEWGMSLGTTQWVPLAVGVATGAVIVGVRRLNDRLPSAAIGLALATVASVVFDLPGMGVSTVGDIAPIPRGLPDLILPDLTLIPTLVPLAVAVTLLSMVESTSIARSLATHTGQRLDLSWELGGEGAANLTAALVGGYPTTGSLTRSALNHREGAASRMAGVISGVLVLIAVVSVGWVLDAVPVAALAGLLITVAWRLIDVPHIRQVMASHSGDRLSFVLTVLGCFLLHLDQAIYLGVGISVILFLRRASLLSLRDMVVDSRGYLREVSARGRELREDGTFEQEGVAYDDRIHILNVAGAMFFGAAGELQNALDTLLDSDVQVLIVRLKRARHLDVTTSAVLADASERMRRDGRLLLVVGLSDGARDYLDRVGALSVIGPDNVFPTSHEGWFEALADALRHATRVVNAQQDRTDGPYARWLARRTSPEM